MLPKILNRHKRRSNLTMHMHVKQIELQLKLERNIHVGKPSAWRI